VTDLLSDLRHGLRILAKNPGFGLVAVLTLALGTSATTAIFSIVQAVVLRPLPFAAQDRLVTAWKKDTVSRSPFVELSLAEFKDWEAQSQSFTSVAAMPTTAYGYGYVMTGRGEPVLLESSKVTGRFFSMLGVAPALGRTLEESDDRVGAPRVVILSHRLWRDRFDADPRVIGQTIALTGAGHTIVGVMPAAFEFPRGVDLWLPISSAMNPRTTENRGAVFLQAVGRLKPGVTLQQAEAELDTIIARVAAAHESGVQKGLRHFNGLTAANDTPAEGQHIGAVILAGEVSSADIVRHCRANSVHLVRGDGDADSRAAHGDPKNIFVRRDAFAHGPAIVGIVHRFFRPCAQIIDKVFRILQQLSNGFLDGKAGVVRARGNSRLRRKFRHVRLWRRF
jgi:hypothetical protein